VNVSHFEVVANWTLQLATIFADRYSVALGPRHESFLELYRALYFSQQKHPSARSFIKSIKEKNSSATMLELIELFGERPLFVLSYIAGLPKPPHCI